MNTKVQIIQLLKTNDRAVARALVVLNERQTNDEQYSEHTKYNNGRGFRPCHARMGTSMAKFFLKFNRLSDKQIAYWRVPMRDGKMRIEIYAGQLLEIAQQKERAKKAREQQKPYMGQDVGNLMEERMVREEANPQDPKIIQIDLAVKAMQDEREMQEMEAAADREETKQDEYRKFLAKCRMERA